MQGRRHIVEWGGGFGGGESETGIPFVSRVLLPSFVFLPPNLLFFLGGGGLKPPKPTVSHSPSTIWPFVHENMADRSHILGRVGLGLDRTRQKDEIVEFGGGGGGLYVCTTQ